MPKPTAPRSKAALPLARYANYFEVAHNPCEFLVDFCQYQPETERVVLHTRIALGPTHAKLLAGMLDRSIARYEEDNGAIPQAADSMDPLEAVLGPLPDFERRAVNARLRDVGLPRAGGTGPSKTLKR